MPEFPGFAHAAVTVSDLERSTQWYTAMLGSEPVLDENETTGGFHHTVFAIGGGQLLGLHTHPGHSPDNQFDEHQPGLDHLSFSCANREELVAWCDQLDELSISHGGVVDASYGSGVSFRDPDNIALEFFAPPAG